jgi:porphobilinogen synthase
MAGCFHFSPDTIIKEAEEIAKSGIPAMLLFGLPSKKDKSGCEAWAEDGAVQVAIRQIKDAVPELVVITDVCLCAYTSTGHCGVIKDGKVDNDTTCELLAKVALSHAQAGADIIAPSDMMDGRVKAIRECLEKNGFPDVAIMSYAAKFASAFYGPFRDAAESAPVVRLGSPQDASTGLADRKTYQMDTADGRQALAEIALDIEEGADIVMVKPALPYLDIIRRARDRFDCPIAAYHVSGEYMMVCDSANAGHIDKDAAMLEILTGIRRAGADIVITYFAKEAAKILR